MHNLVKTKRIVTFVPAKHADHFARTIAKAIPHLFGDYDSVCWWSTPKMENGTEQYRPLDESIQQVPSVRMEFSIPADERAVQDFTLRLKDAHPWKEPVILLFDSVIVQQN